jgi:catechol 2,3-dioxygenase-like lactoylglutathione lyase family enzyme
MPIGKLDHYSIRTLDVEASRRFYTEIMGFQVGYRPEFNFPGLWLYNDRPYPESYGVVHIIGVDLNNPQGLKEYLGDRDLDSLKGTGTVDHMAFAATGLADMRKRLDRNSIPSASAPSPRSACTRSSSRTLATSPLSSTIPPARPSPADELQAPSLKLQEVPSCDLAACSL